METFEQIFLQIIHDACTNKTSSIAIAPQDMDALLALVKDQSCVPYVLPYLNDKKSSGAIEVPDKTDDTELLSN